MLETFGGLLLLLGLFTRPVAFVLAGMMAVAYFMAHAPQSFYPAINGGDAAILFCFVFLYLFTAGPGPWSVDAQRQGGVTATALRPSEVGGSSRRKRAPVLAGVPGQCALELARQSPGRSCMPRLAPTPGSKSAGKPTPLSSTVMQQAPPSADLDADHEPEAARGRARMLDSIGHELVDDQRHRHRAIGRQHHDLGGFEPRLRECPHFAGTVATMLASIACRYPPSSTSRTSPER